MTEEEKQAKIDELEKALQELKSRPVPSVKKTRPVSAAEARTDAVLRQMCGLGDGS